ncbi:ABC transporter permease [Salinibacter grassmerensis]|uniref:ABC transporter permease n=1 Tax=Salinibacter grassmerensis TaxID=3040353 RepID=UPI0021E76316|nr:ABC transporter permease [Salinibacter grassmerensis]
MLRNHLTVALRRMRRHLGYTTINVLGLAVGLAVCACIGLYVADELSYDDFHPTGDRLHRVVTDLKGDDHVRELASTPQPVGPILERKYPEVETAVRLHNAREPTVKVGAQFYRDRSFFYAEPDLFESFGFTLQRGDSTALRAPRSVVLTERTARTYFGDQDPMGQTIVADETEYTVTGIVDDPPANTHLQFEGVFSYSSLSDSQQQSWGNINAYTYLVLSSGADVQSFEEDIAQFVDEETGGRVQEVLGMTSILSLQQVSDIHLHSDRRYALSESGDIQTVSLFAGIAVLVLLVACINFMNLATARSMDRAREVGVRKAIGATQSGLAGQFLAESVLTVLSGAVLAVGLVAVGLPLVNAVSGKTLSVSTLAAPTVIVGAIVGVTMVGVLAGSYPALVLSRFQPARVLQDFLTGSRQRQWLRKGLVVFQFGVAMALVIGVAVILRQFAYMQGQDLGFQDKQVLVADLRPVPDTLVAQQYRTLKQELSRAPSIQRAAVTGGVPGRSIADGIVVRPEGHPDDETRDLRRYDVDADYLETLDLEVIAGRGFRPGDRGAKDPRPVLVNETAVEVNGWDRPRTAVGKTMRRNEKTLYEVVGVVEDYHHFSLRQKIEPLFLRFAPEGYEYAAMRVGPGQASQALDHLRQTSNDLYPAYPTEHFFLDADFERQYQAERRLASIFGGFAGLALFVACLGLLGLAAFTVRQRRKEIGIRKVLGATMSHLLGLLSKDFLALVGIAFVVAAPGAYLGAQAWLEGFAYRVDLGPWLFLSAGIVVALLALGTVSVHSIRAALVDPAPALREE